MRLLFDQNISYRITKIISKSFTEAKHVSHVGLENATDMEIWEFARSNDFSIVTFDSDYYDLNIVKGYPPKIIWLRTGNTATKRIAEILETEIDIIKLFLTDSSYKDLSCLEID